MKSDASSFLIEQTARAEIGVATFSARHTSPSQESGAELSLWLDALQSFFAWRNHPLAETASASVASRNWANEMCVACRVILRCAQLARDLINADESADHTPRESDAASELNFLAPAEEIPNANALPPDFAALIALNETFDDARVVCENLLEAPQISFAAWTSVGNILARSLAQNKAAQNFARASRHQIEAALPLPLLQLARGIGAPPALGADIRRVFAQLTRLLERLRAIEHHLRRDLPLKQTLAVFTLVHEEARLLQIFIERRVMRIENLDETVFDALDGTNYAIGMELRKVFAHELPGLCALRQAPAIYAKVENAHGLLRDCFQQSIIALAQLFDPAMDGARLFNTFQTKLEQSIALRSDLWTVLQLVRRAEQERERYPIARLLERLNLFRDGSLRYLMYKDWEACERFIEETTQARGAIELTPVLHRFGAYLETLHGQINMRAVLASHPFDYPALESLESVI